MKIIKIFLILLFLVSITLTEIYAQKNIKGRIIDENLDELMGIRILNDNNLLGETDFNGFFDVILPNGSNKLIFGYIGYEVAEVEIADSCNYVEIILLYDANYDFMSIRKIDRLRKKSFDNLSPLHLTAIEKGLFTNKAICYSRKFEYNKPRLDEIGKRLKVIKKQIKRDYRNLSIGDTIRIPFGGSKGRDGTDNTTLSEWASWTDTEHFDCIIEGVVIKKYRKRYHSSRFWQVSLERGYNFTYSVTNCENCKYDSIVYDKKAMRIGQEFEYDMKISKTIIK